MSRFERWLLLGSTALVTATGIAYLWMRYAMTPPDEFAVINHPLQPLALAAHILLAPLLVFALGGLTVHHAWTHYRNGVRDGRRSGVALALLGPAMILTGYLIQTVTHEAGHQVVVWGHVVTGVLFAGLLLQHRSRSRQPPAVPQDSDDPEETLP